MHSVPISKPTLCGGAGGGVALLVTGGGCVGRVIGTWLLGGLCGKVLTGVGGLVPL